MDDYIVILLIIMIFVIIYVYREQLYRMSKRHDRRHKKTNKKPAMKIEVTEDEIENEKTFGDDSNYEISEIDYSSKLSEDNSIM
jgi:hypothetical protein